MNCKRVVFENYSSNDVQRILFEFLSKTILDKYERRRKMKVLGGGEPMPLNPFTQSNLLPRLICFFYHETDKLSTSIREGFHVLLDKPCHDQEHHDSACFSCMAPERVRERSEFG